MVDAEKIVQNVNITLFACAVESIVPNRAIVANVNARARDFPYFLLRRNKRIKGQKHLEFGTAASP
jgi:hypothetical protein